MSDPRAGHRGRALALLALALLVPVSCSSDSPAKHSMAEGCALNSDCNAGLVCTFSRCHEECKTSVDCPRGSRCIIGDTSKQVCILPLEDSSCNVEATCAQPLTCASDGKCRNACQGAVSCVDRQVCASDGVCADENEVDASGKLIGRLRDGGTGNGTGSGGAMSSGGTTGAGGVPGAAGGSDGGGAGAGTGGTGGSASGGAAACLGVLPDGGCSYCPEDACTNGTCVSGRGDYSCECTPGYVGTGTKACALGDACAAFLGCSVDYPCVPTQISGGFSCQGQFASWPMPDRVKGATTAPSYSGNAATVVDNVTGLEWQRTTVTNCAVGDAGTTPCTAGAAKAFCAALELGGKGDYRLPTKVELESLLDCTHSVVPYIDTNAFPDALTASYWTASPVVGQIDYWFVAFDTCGSSYSPRETGKPVRCVRGTGLRPGTAPDHYTVVPGLDDAGSLGEVHDNRTGLTWQGGAGSPKAMPFAGATALCASLGGGNRLPTEKELLTLVDPSRISPAIDVGVFEGTASYNFWTSQGVTVDFSKGQTSVADGSGAYTRCVHLTI